jgi:hypothetical protein
MHPDYREWLRLAVPSEATFRTKLSELRRVEAIYGNLDDLYDLDELSSLIDELTYTAQNARDNLPNPSKLVIDGDLRNNLASYKSAVMKYARFRQDVETEAARPAASHSASVAQDDPLEDEHTFSLERDLQNALRRNIEQLEPGLKIIDGGEERTVSSGRIDILAQDAQGAAVVIELKAVKARRDVIGQILAYMGDISQEYDQVRGILVAPEYEDRVIAASRVVKKLDLKSYGFSFSFATVE